jgi:peptidyl-prolyl cis-trans isomerase SurA
MLSFSFRTLPRALFVLLAGSLALTASLSAHAAGAAASTTAAAPAKETATLRAAAVVNDFVISTYDLDQRVKLVMATSGASGPEVAKKLRQQVLRQLIDELLQLQEAQKSKITVSAEDLDKSLKRIAQQNNITVDQIYKTLDENRISRNTLQSQIKADLAWQKLVQQRLAPRVTVSDDDVTNALLQAQESSKQPQYALSEIFLAVDVPSAEEQVKQSMIGVVSQLKGGANFSALARQFSQSSTATNGGDMGWVTLGELPEPIANQVKSMAVGAVSDPIRASGGYYLIGLRQRRLAAGATPPPAAAQPAQAPQPEQKMKPIVTLGRVSVPLDEAAPKGKIEQMRQNAIEIFRSINGCPTAGAIARSHGAKFDMIGPMTVKDLAPQFADILRKTPNGRSTPPLRGAKGIEMYVICEGGMRPAASVGGGGDVDRPSTEASREEIENRLFNQELTMLSRRYLRDLRRDATIEMKDN